MKILWSKVYKRLGAFRMLTFKGCSETVFFKEWSNPAFDSLQFSKQKGHDDIFKKKTWKFDVDSTNGTKKVDKAFVFKGNCICIGTTSCQNPEHHCCDLQSMYYETPLRFNVSLTEIFLKSGSLRGMKKYDQNSLIQILQEAGTL